MITVLLPCQAHGEAVDDGMPAVEVPIEHVMLVPIMGQCGIALDQVRAVCTVDKPHVIRWPLARHQRDELLDLGVRRGTLAEFRAIVDEFSGAYAAGGLFPDGRPVRILSRF